MTDAGKLLPEKFDISQPEDGKVSVTPKPNTFEGKTPEFESVTLRVANVQEITVQPVDKNGQPVGQPTSEKVKTPEDNSEQTVVLVLNSPQPSSGLVITFVKTTSDKPSSVTVVTIVACLSEDG